MILLCGLIFGVSCLSACCKYVPNVNKILDHMDFK